MEELERLLRSDKNDFKKFDREAYLLYSLLQVKTGRKKDGGTTTTLYDWCIAINSGKKRGVMRKTQKKYNLVEFKGLGHIFYFARDKFARMEEVKKETISNGEIAILRNLIKFAVKHLGAEEIQNFYLEDPPEYIIDLVLDALYVFPYDFKYKWGQNKMKPKPTWHIKMTPSFMISSAWIVKENFILGYRKFGVSMADILKYIATLRKKVFLFTRRGDWRGIYEEHNKLFWSEVERLMGGGKRQQEKIMKYKKETWADPGRLLRKYRYTPEEQEWVFHDINFMEERLNRIKEKNIRKREERIMFLRGF